MIDYCTQVTPVVQIAGRCLRSIASGGAYGAYELALGRVGFSCSLLTPLRLPQPRRRARGDVDDSLRRVEIRSRIGPGYESNGKRDVEYERFEPAAQPTPKRDKRCSQRRPTTVGRARGSDHADRHSVYDGATLHTTSSDWFT